MSAAVEVWKRKLMLLKSTKAEGNKFRISIGSQVVYKLMLSLGLMLSLWV